MTNHETSQNLDEFLDTPLVHIPELDGEPVPRKIELVELSEGEIDPRLKLLSHSSRELLAKCPRKYQLYRLTSKVKESHSQEEHQKDYEDAVTFAYGHTVGVGVQEIFEGADDNKLYMACFLAWGTDLLAENTKQKKSFWNAMFAVQKFEFLREESFIKDYELVYTEGKPAVELSAVIYLPNDFYYRLFIDVVVQHRETGEVVVIENKTTSGTAKSEMYRNSGQAIGYSVVLDKLFPDLSSYSVLYTVYETKSFEWVTLSFGKSLLQRALWLQELLIDVQSIELYEAYGVYPMRGHACFDYFRACKYFGLCTLSTENLTKPLDMSMLEDLADDLCSYQYHVQFDELVEAQIEKG